MAIPTTRQEFKQYCLRRLGAPVIEINVDDDQVEDRIDESLKYYWDYHFDGSEKIYYRHLIQEKDYPGKITEIIIEKGGTGYSNTDAVSISETNGSGATATITTDANGSIIAVNMQTYGNNYFMAPDVTVVSDNGTGAVLTALNGGYITLPDNVIGTVRIFSLGDPMITNSLFDLRYQIALNDLYTLTNVSMVPYYLAFQHIQFLQDFLVGQQPIRYNRHRNRMYIDMNWQKAVLGHYIVVEAYQVIDPDVYTDAWGDRWLMMYASALIKRQWGANLTKFTGMQLPGGVQFNGDKIYADAQREIDKLEAEMISSYSLPVTDMIG
jgi:hypothetical protein